MNLMKFKGADDAVKLTIRLSAGYCIILTIAFASSIIFLINKIEKVLFRGCRRHWYVSKTKLMVFAVKPAS